MDRQKLKLLILTALIGALCVVGSWIKIPGPISTAALDSAPAFLSVLFLPPLYSGFAGLIGHFATAYSGGMPLGPLHIIVAIEMFIIVYIFNVMHRKNWHITKWLFLIVANGVLAPLPFYFIISPAYFFGALPFILSATVINVVIVLLLIPFIQPIVRKVGWNA